MLELNNVTFTYTGQEHSYEFSLECQPGEIISISGVSGSGKSTLLDLIAGFQTPQSGEISLDGKNLNTQRPEQRPVALLFQNNNLFDHLTTHSNLALALPNHSKTDVDDKIANALASVDLTGFETQKADSLSGGQKQRVALARTLLLNRSILLLDEPFSALDTKSAQNMRNLVRTLVQKNKWHTILVTHHDQDHAIADRTFYLADHKLSPKNI